MCIFMGNRQISHYAFTYLPNPTSVYCDTVLYYEVINFNTLNVIRNDLMKSHSQLLHTNIDYILAALAYIIREKKEKFASYSFYKTGALIAKIAIKRPNMDLEQQKIETEYSHHIQCNLDILFLSTK